MNLHEFMHTPAITCTPATTISEVGRLMEEREVGSVVVVGTDGALLGIVTDRDLAVRAVAHRREPDTPVSELMTENVVFVRSDANVFAAATEMATAGCRRMPVLDDNGTIAGVVALDDLLTLFARQTDKIAEAVAAEMPHEHGRS
jgi:signal-transduction protein with cAMP-binding, CBS, and nucleotidyltransferase domain